MKKAAIFVEGQTELYFVAALLQAYCPNKLKIHCTPTVGKIIHKLAVGIEPSEACFEIVLIDCHGDGGVLSRMTEQYRSQSLRRFNLQLGLRDIFPDHDVETLKQKQRDRLKLAANDKLPAKLCFAVRELEAWFIAELTHITRIRPTRPLSIEQATRFLAARGEAGSVEAISAPATTLHEMYQDQGYGYSKKSDRTTEVIHAIDFDRLYIQCRRDVAHLDELLTVIDDFFTTP